MINSIIVITTSITALILLVLLVVYDKDEQKTIKLNKWVSKLLFRNEDVSLPVAARLTQTVKGFLLIFLLALIWGAFIFFSSS